MATARAHQAASQAREAIRRGARVEARDRRVTRAQSAGHSAAQPARSARSAQTAASVRTAASPLVRQPARPGRPDLRIVPTTVRRRRGVRLIVVLASSAFALMIGLTAFQIQLAQNQLEIDRVAQAAELARERYTDLRKENASLRSPERLSAMASELGMVPGRAARYATVPAEVAQAVSVAAGHLLDSDVTGESDPFAEHERIKRILQGDVP